MGMNKINQITNARELQLKHAVQTEKPGVQFGALLQKGREAFNFPSMQNRGCRSGGLK